MSCGVCQVHQGGFASEQEFVRFRNHVGSLVKSDVLENLGQIDLSGPFVKIKYQCKQCGQLWVLEFPDQAFRGGWKKLA